MNTIRLLTASLSLAAAVGAQTVVSPAAWANVESPTGNAFPFGSTATPFRYVNIHDDMAGTPRSITGFALRRSATTSTTTIAAHSVTVDGWMSTAATTGATVDATFDNNHSGDKMQVLTGTVLNFPAAGTGVVPYPFLYNIPLDSPFAFAGAGPLCWEVHVLARNPGLSNSHDYIGAAVANPSMVVSRYGDGCIATGRTTAFGATGAGSLNWTTTMMGSANTTLSNGPASAAVVLVTGFQPFVPGIQIPGTDSGSPSGTCYMNTDPLIFLGGVLTAAGGVTIQLPLNANPALNGLILFSQAASLDASANNLGLVTSNAVNHQVVAPYGAQPGGRAWSSGNLNATGSVGAGTVLITQFSY